MAARTSRDGFSQAQIHHINVAPFVGVMLVLLSVFMLAAPPGFSRIPVEVPQGLPGTERRPEPVLVNIQPGGKLFIGATQTSLDALVDDVATFVARPDTADSIMVRADRAVPLKDFTRVLNALETAGYQTGLILEDL